MRRRIVRWSVAAFLVLVGAACPAVGVAMASTSQAQPGQQQSAQTISALDREFLTVINFANLWEMPMGKLATERGNSQAVRDAGAVISADHTKLDGVVNQLADRFGVRLPDQPSSSTQAWMNEISAKTGEDFDDAFANRLRAAHGTVFGLIAEVRAGTRNPVIRDFATQANDIVMKHMTLLEATGQVSADHGMFAEAAARQISYPENTLTRGDLLLAGVVAVLMAAATIGIVRTFSAPGPAE
jgi:predicted outer membrane protein